MGEDGLLREASPTLVAALRRCGLAVHLTRAHRARAGFSPSNPPSRLGAAAHRVLGWVAESDPAALGDAELEAAVRRRWDDEVAIEEKAAAGSPQESYFGRAPQWPGFATIQERLVIEAQRLAAGLSESPAGERWVERSLSCGDPPMRGSPDLVEIESGGARVIEFKSGRVESADASPDGRYGLQVLLYAAMVRETGHLVGGGEIRPLGRSRFAVEVSEDSIDAARAVARAAVGEFNAAIEAGDPARLARPSDRSCGYCPHTLRCPALWQGDGSASLDEMQILEGAVVRLQRSHSGSTAVEMETVAGTVHGTIILTGLDARRVPALDELQPGDRARASGLRCRPGGSGLGPHPGMWVQLTRAGAGKARL